VLAVSAAHAAQPTFPERPIRLVIGSAPGSGPDIIARVLADRLYTAWGQRIVVDPRPGMAGIISADLVMRSVPDGYTWLMLTSQLPISTAMYSNHKIDLARDFASISLIGTVPFILTVGPELPAKSIRELIDLAKKTPLRYGSAGAGTTEHFCGFLFAQLTGSKMLHVPYKGIGQALTDTIGKEVHLTYAVPTVALPLLQAGRLRALGVTSAKRSAVLPDVPAIAETVPGYEMIGWSSLVAPTGTPAEVLIKASAEAVKATKAPEFGEQLKPLGQQIVGSTRAELDAFRREQTKRIDELVKASGLDLN
jgi:tripartite-type tricarboxylate transporter receptor subunit TctC